MAKNTLHKRVLQSALKLDDIEISKAIEIIETRIGVDNCTIVWAIEDAEDTRFSCSFYAGITYFEILHSISAVCDYVLLYHEETSKTGKAHIYLSFLKRIAEKD